MQPPLLPKTWHSSISSHTWEEQYCSKWENNHILLTGTDHREWMFYLLCIHFRFFYLFVWLSIRYSHSIYLLPGVTLRAFLTAKTRSSVHTPDARETRVELALKHANKTKAVQTLWATFAYWWKKHMYNKKWYKYTYNTHLVYVIAVHPVSCIPIRTGRALEIPWLGADAHVLSEAGSRWALSQMLRLRLRLWLHDKLPWTWSWTSFGWTTPKTCWAHKCKHLVEMPLCQ